MSIRSESNENICPTCRGVGWILFEMPNEVFKDENGRPIKYEYAERCPTCKGGRMNEVDTLRKKSAIPESFGNMKMDAFRWDVYTNRDGTLINTKNIKRWFDSYVDDFPKWQDKGMGLFIFSRTKGSGKTFAASCLANTVISRYAIRVRFESAVNLISVQNSADKASNKLSESDPIIDMANVPLLILDDIGCKDSNAWIDEILFTITDKRMQRKLTTIMTSNMPIAELPYGDRIVDRINNICIEVSMPEVCIRARESNKNKADFARHLGLLEGDSE